MLMKPPGIPLPPPAGQLSHPAAAELVALLGGGPVAVLSGAGLSTASGIPAYRDRAGEWKHSSPVMHQEFLNSATRRQRYWARSFVGWPTLHGALPNRGHQALAALESLGAVAAVITQNVDGLHQKAGNREVIELHGSLGQVRCLACGGGYARAEVQGWLQAANHDFLARHTGNASTAPDGDAHLAGDDPAHFKVPGCPACAGILKPDVVFFGDSVPRERVQRAAQAVEKASALMVVGSSLMVYSGFRCVEQAHRLGKPIIVINQGVTRADALPAHKIEADCGEVLADLLAAFEGSP